MYNKWATASVNTTQQFKIQRKCTGYKVSAVSESHDQVKHTTYIYTGDKRSDKGPASNAVALGMQHREAQQEI